MSCAFSGFEAVWSIFPLIFMAFFIAVVVMIIKKVAADRAERRLPIEERWGRVVTKRTEVRGSETTSTYYYVTIEFDDGSRQELHTDGSIYGSVAEGDIGYAGIQGKRLAGFRREAGMTENKEEVFSSWHRCASCGATFRGERCDYCGTPWTEEK
jgi:hypothetical protein